MPVVARVFLWQTEKSHPYFCEACMVFPLTFLTASLPLTKTIETLSDGQIHKSPYPMVSTFTSEVVQINNIGDFYKALIARAKSPKKPCLIKGNLNKELKNQPRKGTTQTNDETQYVCFDIDGGKFSSPEEVMAAAGLSDISYISQFSSSYKITKSPLLSCHIFFILEKPMRAPELKAWLMHLNLSLPAFANSLSLCEAKSALHWPLDITTCQNDKLLYIAEPIFKNMRSPCDLEERIQLHIKTKPVLTIKRIDCKPIEGLKKAAHEKKNQLRVEAGISPLKTKVRMDGEHEVQQGVGEISRYEVIDCGEYNRLNLNGGDSQAYWHYKDKPKLLHNFKGEPSLFIKEILPHYYADLLRNAAIVDATPSEEGDLLLAFREKKTAQYWKGTWNPDTKMLDIDPVKSELQLDHFLQGHGRSLGAFVPEWRLEYDPHNPVIVDEATKLINTFQPTEYMRKARLNKVRKFPMIQRVIDSAVGTGEIQEHFMNWLAVIWQQRVKPMTAWVLHGVEGTGKNMLFDLVLRPLFGHKNTVIKRASELNSSFNPWIEKALVACINEIEADMFISTKGVEADLKSLICDPTVNVRVMRTDSYEVQNYTAFLFFSNKKKPVSIGIGDRRFNVGHFQSQRFLPTPEDVEGIKDELEGFAHFLSTYKANFHQATQVLQTADRMEIQKRSITSVDALAEDLLTGNLVKIWESMPDERLMEESGIIDVTASAYATLVRRFILEEESRITRDELAVIFKHCVGIETKGTSKFTALLGHHGITLVRQRAGNDRTYSLDVKWAISPSDLRSMREDLKAQPIRLKRVK